MTQQDALYRLITLRRLTALGVLTIALGVWGAQAISGAQPFGSGVNGPLMVFGICSGLLVWHNLIYPSGWIEALALPIATSLSLVAYAAMFASGGGTFLLIALCTAVVFCAGFLAAAGLLSASFGMIPKGEVQRVMQVHLDVSADAFAAWAFETPEATKGARRAGAMNAQGLIPVWLDICAPTEANGFVPTAPAASYHRTPDYYFRIMEDGPRYQIVQTIMPGVDHKGEPLTSMTHFSVTETGPQSCFVTEREVHNLWNFHTYLLAWLQNDSADYYREIRDAIHGCDSPAIRVQSRDTLLAGLARYFVEQGLADPS